MNEGTRETRGAGARAALGVICALPQELGLLGQRAVRRRRVCGLEVLELDQDDGPVRVAVAGVGKVRAARAAALLLALGDTRGLLVVGTCGGLTRGLAVGTLVHCLRTAQTDLAVREGREVEADAGWRAAWREVAPGPEAWFLTGDRPVLSRWRRRRLTRAWSGAAVADMETAAVAVVARAAGVPWAALRAVTDLAGAGGGAMFRLNLSAQGGRAADSVLPLLQRLGPGPAAPRPGPDLGLEAPNR